MKCVVFMCPNTTINKRDGVSFHQFPKNEAQKRKWLRTIRLPDINIGKSTLICSDHFLESDLVRFISRTLLIEGAIPVLKIESEQATLEYFTKTTCPKVKVEGGNKSTTNLISLENIIKTRGDHDNYTGADYMGDSSLNKNFLHREKQCANGSSFAPARKFTEKEAYRQSYQRMASIKHVATVQQRMDTKCWTPIQLIDLAAHKQIDYALLVLNTKIEVPKEVTCSLWENARCRVLVDGGTNRWLSFLHDLPNRGEEMKCPDIINGDFDSIDKKTLDMFRERGSSIKYTPDQNETDFTKALRLLKPMIHDHQISSVIALQEHGTRFDHIMANINTLFKASNFLNDTKLYLLNGGSLTWLLTPGKHSIQIPSHLVSDKRWCSMIPIGGVTTVTTKGFKWDLNNDALEFGKLVSTSNTYALENLEITTDRFLVWSMGVFNFE